MTCMFEMTSVSKSIGEAVCVWMLGFLWKCNLFSKKCLAICISPAHRREENGPKVKPTVDAQQLWKRKVPQWTLGGFGYKVLQVLSTEVRSDLSQGMGWVRVRDGTLNPEGIDRDFKPINTWALFATIACPGLASWLLDYGLSIVRGGLPCILGSFWTISEDPGADPNYKPN